jgi:parvulin-like peptidyl-prolyl isomerase
MNDNLMETESLRSTPPSLEKRRTISRGRRSSFARSLTIVVAVATNPGVPGIGTGSPPLQEPTDGAVVARVNGEAMMLDDLELYLGSLHQSATSGDRGAFDLDRLMFRAVNDMLLAQEARALGMQDDEAVTSRVEKYREKLALEMLEREEIADKAVPTDEEVRRFFEDQYRTITLRVITAYEKPEAEALLAEVRSGADMATLARERSVDPYGPRDGLVKSVARIDLQPEIAELALGLEPGEIGGPVRTDLGWSVIRLEAIEPADPERFSKLVSFLQATLRARKAAELRKNLAAGIRDRHSVTIDDDVLGSFRPERLPDARLVPRVEDPSAVVARVGEKQVVTAGEYSKALMERWANVRNEEAARAAAPKVLEDLITQRLLLAEALARGYADRPEIRRRIRAHERELLVPLYLEEVVAADIEVSREEMKAYFEQHRQKYRRPPRIRLGQITVATMEEAERVRALLRQGSDLAWLAREHSIDRFKESGGDRGWVEPRPGGPNEKLLETSMGDVLEPFGVPGNYVVLKILAREEQGLYSYDEVSGNVREAVFSQKLAGAIETFMDTLRSRSEIEINEELLKSLRITGKAPGHNPHPKPEADLGFGRRQRGAALCG